MFLSIEQIRDSLSNLESVHPIYGTTFLACKLSNLPVGKTIHFAISDVETAFLDKFYRPFTQSQYFYRVFSTVNGGRARETDLFAGLRACLTGGT